jgi:hypothetical protein
MDKVKLSSVDLALVVGAALIMGVNAALFVAILRQRAVALAPLTSCSHSAIVGSLRLTACARWIALDERDAEEHRVVRAPVSPPGSALALSPPPM